jgi:hypothetical protein
MENGVIRTWKKTGKCEVISRPSFLSLDDTIDTKSLLKQLDQGRILAVNDAWYHTFVSDTIANRFAQKV